MKVVQPQRDACTEKRRALRGQVGPIGIRVSGVARESLNHAALWQREHWGKERVGTCQRQCGGIASALGGGRAY